MSDYRLRGQNIIYFGPGNWEGMWRNRHQLMSRFARCNQVLYVEPQVAGRFGPAISSRWLPSEWIAHIVDNLYVFKGPGYPIPSLRRPFKDLFSLYWKLALKSAIRKLNLKNPIIWYAHPNMYYLIKWFSSRLVVYHIVDEYAGYTNVDPARRARIQNMEHRMLASADLAIVVSQNLLEAKRKYNPQTYLVPNGVDFNRFDTVAGGDWPTPADVGHIRKPIIGYAGLISARLDLELIARLAEQRPEWSFILVGEVKDRHCRLVLDRMEQTANIHFTGTKKVDELPHYLKLFDVGLIPYQVNLETDHADPLKLYEYMAMGKPVVSTAYAAAQGYKDVISIVRNEDQAAAAIHSYLENDSITMVSRRHEIAAGNTWDQRVEQISTILTDQLNAGKG